MPLQNPHQNVVASGSHTRAMTAASGNISYTGYGFKPTSIIVSAHVDNASGSMGMMINSGLENCIFIQGLDPRVADGQVVRAGSAADGQNAEFVSYDDDGFTLSWSKYGAPPGTCTMRVIAFR